MDAIGLVGTTESPTAPWIPFFAGLVAAGAVACILCQLPSPHSLSWNDAFLLAASYVVAGAVASAIAIWCVGAILPDAVPRDDTRKLILFELLTIVWFPSLMLLLRENSPWAILVAAVAMASLTKAFRTLRTATEESNTELLDDPPEYKFLQVPNSSPLIRRLFPLLCVAVCIQIGLLTLLTNHLFAAAALFGISSSLLTWRLSVQSIQPPSEGTKSLVAPPRTPSRIWLISLLAILFTSIALVPYVSNRQLAMRLRAYLNGPRLFRAIVPLEHRTQVEEPKTSYSSVILWPVLKKHKKIVAPSPVSNLFTEGPHATILKIPFNGVYWYFKAPDTRPNPDAHIQHGNPMKVDVRSTDWRPILMEARQNLGAVVDLNCCSQIRVAIQNADNRPGTIALGVILTNTRLPGKPSISLGREPVTSSHPVKFSIDRPPVSEVLNFRIPENPRIRQFNEITVVFQPAPGRALAGAKIAIQQFMLVPKWL
jgi:hypothetical protein